MTYARRNPIEQRDPTPQKPINPFPLIAMLVIVVFLVLWLNGVFA